MQLLHYTVRHGCEKQKRKEGPGRIESKLTDRLERLRLAPLPPPQLNESNLAAIPPMSSLNIPDMIRTAPDLSHVSPVPSIQGTDQEDNRMTGQVKRS